MAFEPPFLYPDGLSPSDTMAPTVSVYENGVLVGEGTGAFGFTLESVAVPAGTFANCVRIRVTYSFPEPIGSGGSNEWWARGVGMVKRDNREFGDDTYQELTSATVGGVHYP